MINRISQKLMNRLRFHEKYVTFLIMSKRNNDNNFYFITMHICYTLSILSKICVMFKISMLCITEMQIAIKLPTSNENFRGIPKACKVILLVLKKK